MNESQKDFRERLLEAEQLSLTLKEKYEKEVQAMLEEKLTGVGRGIFIFWAVFGIGLGVVFGIAAVLAPKDFPILARIGFVSGAIFGLAFGGLMGWIARKGIFKVKVHSMAVAGMAWVFVIIMLTLFMVMGGKHPDSVRSVFMVVCGLVYLVVVVLIMILGRISYSELKTREKLLEIEYRLAQIAEQITKKEQD